MSPAHLTALAPDPVVPARDVVLDPVRVGARLPELLGLSSPLDGCDLVRAKYRIGEGVRALYRLGSRDQEYLIAARSFRDGAGASAFRNAMTDVVHVEGVAPVVHDTAIDTVWWTFPNDRKLTSLAALMEPESWAWGAEWRGWARSEMIQFAQERTATVRASDRAGTTVGYAKAYAPDAAGAISELVARYELMAEGFALGGTAVTSPRVLASSSERGIVLYEAMPGRLWGEIENDAQTLAMGRLGEALARTHNFDTTPFVDAGIRSFGRLRADRAVHCAELVGRARPDVAELAAGVGARLAATEPVDPGVDCVLHGDVHPNNALLDGDRIAMIDIDQAGLGPAAADVASLIVRMRYGAIMGEWDVATASDLIDVFLVSYSAHRALPAPDAIRWHVAAALVAERALRAVSRVYPDGLAKLETVLREADATLDREPW